MATSTKAALREQLLLARLDVADEVRAAEARMLAEHAERLVSSGDTVCAYVPVGSEPGSIEMLDALLRRAQRVLVPVARTADGTPLPLRWGEYRPGALTRGNWGLLEPTEPWLPQAALAEAALVIVPALAVDHRGARLGRGRGFYDRSLPGRRPARTAYRRRARRRAGRRVAGGTARRADDRRPDAAARLVIARLPMPGYNRREMIVITLAPVLALGTVEC